MAVPETQEITEVQTATSAGDDLKLLAIQTESGNKALRQITPGNAGLYSKTEVDTKLAVTDAAMQQKPNPNLLVNWYWGNPVIRDDTYIVPTGVPIHFGLDNMLAYLEDTSRAPAGTSVNYRFVHKDNDTYSHYSTDDTNYYVENKYVKRGKINYGAYTQEGISGWRFTAPNSAFTIMDDCIRLINLSGGGNKIYFNTDFWSGVNKDTTFNALNQKVTASVLVKGMSGAWKISYRDTTLNVGMNSVTLDKLVGFYIWGNNEVNSYIDIVAVKLEIGERQTLAHQNSSGEWVLNELPDYAEQAALCETFTSYSGAREEPPLRVNPNLFHNWYFGKPIDSKVGYVFVPGTTVYWDKELTNSAGYATNYGTVTEQTDTYVKFHDSAGQYYYIAPSETDHIVRGYYAPAGTGVFFDRWESVGGSGGVCLIRDGYIELIPIGPSYFGFGQKLNDESVIYGKPVTFSALLQDGSLYSYTMTVPQSGTDISNQGIAPIVFFQHSTGNYFRIVLSSWFSENIRKFVAVKLELGERQTLAHKDSAGNWVLNEVPDRAEQSLLCSQYNPETGEYIGLLNVCNKNLLDNWYFADPIYDRNQYYIPTDTPYYPTTALSGRSGAVSNPTNVDFVNTTYGSLNINNVTYYVKFAAMKRGNVGNNRIINRWYQHGWGINANTITDWDSNGVMLSGNYCHIHQQLDDSTINALVDRPVTISALFGDNVLIQKTYTLSYSKLHNANPATNANCIRPDNKGAIVLYDWSGYSAGNACFIVQLHENNTLPAPFVAVKMELGSVQTLAHKDSGGKWVLNEVPNKGTEFLKSVVRPLDVDDIFYSWRRIIYDANGAGFHNSIYRGKSLGSSVTDAQWSAISSGKFTDMYIGDYWTINGTTWRIAGFDYRLNTGDYQCTKHHVMIVPDAVLYNGQMNTTDTTTGGYVGSAMFQSGLDSAKTTINAAFGEGHILAYRNLLTNQVNDNGVPSNWGWYDRTVDLMSERMVYGNSVFASGYYEGGIDVTILPLFALNPGLRCAWRQSCWLRGVASASRFARVVRYGYADWLPASYSRGVRPAFAIC